MPSDDKIQESVAQLLMEHDVKDFYFIETEGDGPGAWGFVTSPPSSGLLLHIKQVRGGSIDHVIGTLAVGILESGRNTDNRRLVFLLIFDRLGEKTAQAVRLFMSKHASDCGWGLVDRCGAARIVIPALNLDIDQPGQTAPPSWPRQRPTRLFSDLNQWMLKILLLADSPPALWNGPRQRVANPTELHRVARVSVEKAHQFVRAFEQIGFIRQTSHGLDVVRKKSLLEMWFSDERSRSHLRMPARWIFGEPASMEQVFSKQDTPGDFAVCGFEACRILGILHAPVMNREVYIFGDPEAALTAWDLETCDERDAHFRLRQAKSAQSILRGRLVKAHLPVVDVFQAALDVCDQAARGTEQSQYIINHVLGWRGGE